MIESIFLGYTREGKRKRQEMLGCKSWKFGCGGGKRGRDEREVFFLGYTRDGKRRRGIVGL